MSFILYNYTDRGLIHDCKVARNAPVVSHLFFAGDNFLLFKSNMQKCGMIKKCLDAYERASGQVVNFQKSSIFFNCNMPIQLKDELCNFLRVRVTEDHGSYLGLPSFIEKNKNAIFFFR